MSTVDVVVPTTKPGDLVVPVYRERIGLVATLYDPRTLTDRLVFVDLRSFRVSPLCAVKKMSSTATTATFVNSVTLYQQGVSWNVEGNPDDIQYLSGELIGTDDTVQLVVRLKRSMHELDGVVHIPYVVDLGTFEVHIASEVSASNDTRLPVGTEVTITQD